MIEKKETDIFYLCVHKRLLERHSRIREVSKKELFHILGGIYHIPRSCKPLVLKKMIDLKLLEPEHKKMSDRTFIILKGNVSLENTSKLYQDYGMF